jgi:putative DNA primase/helicase
MKSPAIEEPLKVLKRLEIAAKEEFDQASTEYEAAKLVAQVARKEGEKEIRNAIKNNKDPMLVARGLSEREPSPPVRPRLLVNDATVEKLGEILNENPYGVTCYRDELIGWLKSLDKENQQGARSFYLEAWNGTGRFTYDRIGRGTIDIEAAIVSVIGAIQPGPLRAYLLDAVQGGRGDDGLMQRFQLAVWPDVSSHWRNVDRCGCGADGPRLAP